MVGKEWGGRSWSRGEQGGQGRAGRGWGSRRAGQGLARVWATMVEAFTCTVNRFSASLILG